MLKKINPFMFFVLGLLILPSFSKATHTVKPMKLEFNKKNKSQYVTLRNLTKAGRLYFNFSVSKKEGDKTVDVTDQKFFRAMPHKFVLEPGEVRKVRVSVENYQKIPKGKYNIFFTPAPFEPDKASLSKDKVSFVCKLVFRYQITAIVE